MDWQAVGVVVSGVLSVAALSVAGLGQRRTDKLAQDAANSARRSADAADRSSAALERLALDHGPQWQLEHLENDAFILTNIGPATVHRVLIDAGDLQIHGPSEFEQVLPGSSVKFLALGSLSASNDTVTVTWAPDEERDVTKTWSRPIPGNPSR